MLRKKCSLIKETIDGLRAINLKLNPKKCSFGLEEGVFSGHLITKQGIKENPQKVKGADKTLPFIRTLKSCTSGKMVQWTAEADEAFQIMKELLEPLLTILADFLAETPSKEEEGVKDEEAKRKEPEPKKAWKLFTDGASSFDGSGAGLILVSLEGKEYTYAVRFEFKTTNNEAKYEALLAGLRLAKEMRVQELTIFVDSQLVANLVNGLFEARQTIIKQYIEKAK
ncbi:reverse transcriptase domain-containing protein [Tanacetum coccineum]